MRPSTLLLLLCTCACLCGAHVSADNPDPPIPRPDHTEHAKLARWLAHYNTWGTLATQASSESAASAGVVSYADGGPLDSPAAGRMFFYLTPMDETGGQIQDNPECALSISEAQLHPNGCGPLDPMEPTCARITMLGRMLPIEATDKALAQEVLFAKHPAMKGWPADHGFAVYELHLRSIRMLDFYGGPTILTPEEYFAADLQPQQPSAQQQQQQQPHPQQQQNTVSLPRRWAGQHQKQPATQ